jgi:GNAT superfamily N-acetyltransferase
MIDPDVRLAVADDAAELRGLERLARRGVAVTRGGGRWLDEHAEIADGWGDAIARRIVLIGEIRGAGVPPVAVGYLLADLEPGERTIVRVDQVFVHSDARQLGFGDALLAEAIRVGRERGASMVEAETLPGDRDLKNLYERAGVTARLIVVSKALRDP